MKCFIGIDPATRCGWAVIGEDGSRIASGVWNLERRRGDGAGMIYVRFERLFRELLDTYDGMVAYEQQASRFAGSAHVGLGIISHLQRICEEKQRPYAGMTFSVIKKHAIGGGAKKAAMVAVAEIRWELEGITDDEADALWIADAAREGLA